MLKRTLAAVAAVPISSTAVLGIMDLLGVKQFNFFNIGFAAPLQDTPTISKVYPTQHQMIWIPPSPSPAQNSPPHQMSTWKIFSCPISPGTAAHH